MFSSQNKPKGPSSANGEYSTSRTAISQPPSQPHSDTTKSQPSQPQTLPPSNPDSDSEQLLRRQRPPPQQPPPPKQPQPPTNSSGQQQEPDPYGLLGLLKVLKMTDRDLNMLASGTDLTTLGLNLSSPDVLYLTFASPFSDTPLKREPEYQIPSCYYIRPSLPPPTDKMSLFSDETLFYIFYSMPRDALQVAAAAELQARDWTYHTEQKLWFQRSPGTTAHIKTLTHEQGSYVYFDVQHWEKRPKTNFRIYYDKLYHIKS